MTTFDKELKRLLGLDEPEFREWVIMQMKKCDERFQATVEAVGASAKQQSDAIAAHTKSSEDRHAFLVDKLSVLIAISEAGETGAKIVVVGSRWSKIWASILILGGIIYGLFHGVWPKG